MNRHPFVNAATRFVCFAMATLLALSFAVPAQAVTESGYTTGVGASCSDNTCAVILHPVASIPGENQYENVCAEIWSESYIFSSDAYSYGSSDGHCYYHHVWSPTSQIVFGSWSNVSTPNPKNNGPSCPCSGDPINPAVANKYQIKTDYLGPGRFPLEFTRTYNSATALSVGHIGANWRSTYDRAVRAVISGGQINAQYPVVAERPDGRLIYFTLTNGQLVTDSDISDHLSTTVDANGHFNGFKYVTSPDDQVELYDSSGELKSIINRSGLTHTVTYSSLGVIASVSDSFGHKLTFTHDSAGRIATMTIPTGQVYTYAYDANGNLASVTNPDTSIRLYAYNESANTGGGNLPNALTGITDESGARYATFQFDSVGHALLAENGAGANLALASYSTDSSGNDVTAITDGLGTQRTYTFKLVLGVSRNTAQAAPLASGSGTTNDATTYDSNGNITSYTDKNGNLTQYSYDETRNLQTSRTEGSGTAAARTITTQWNANYRLPALISEYAGGTASGTPIRTTAFSYDASGNLLTKTITDPATGAAHTWTYTYDSYGRMLTADGPRTDVSDVTTYTYYTCTTGSQCGELDTVTDPLGHVTTYNSYDASGHPLTITDPNGVVTTLTYDARGHLKSRSAAGETTSFSYYPTELLEQVTLPDGSSLSYTYDAAHRLTQVTDGLGNKIVYTLDAMGNRTAENTYDPSGALHRTHSRAINALNQIYQEVNAAGTAAVTTTFGYDNDGNRTSIAAPLSRNTAESYDPLNRVSSITDPGTGVTTFGYDAEDDLTSVKDPRNLTTSYAYDGFGDLTSQVSPDTGTTTNTYDSAGNLATATDARGAVATYGYDALNRVTSIAYSLSGTPDQTLAFTYDQGTDGIGHLTGASDANHSMSFSYDALGEMTGMSQIVGGVTRSIAYGYTSGNLTSIITPSGQTVTYGYNADHQVTSIAVNGTTVISSVSYEPFGPVDGWTWGNGAAFSRSFSGDGLITGISSPGSQEGLSYDNASRINGITNTASGASNWTYGYDPLDRLTSATSSSVTEGWTYDANGNRLSESGTSPSTYSISSTSNEITSITGALTRTYGYDAAGNTLGDSTNTNTYNDAGRLKALTNTSGTTTFIYSALGQMIKASSPSGTTLYAYDQAGHLLGEYDGSGNLIQETVWLGNIPMATIQPSGSSIATYYLVTDQLDTPREIIRPSDNTIMWSWFTGPFGAEAPNTNPQGAGIFAYDMRLPGQIAGAWGSTYQNNFRDYDPEVGRYMEPDPIGLVGGSLSLYAYAAGNALTRIDPSGLSSIDAEIADAIASGDLEELESLLEGANPDQAKLIQDAIQRWTSTADQLISKECQARVRTRFPKSVLNNTLKEIQELSQDGDKDAQTAWKLLNDNRFKK